MFLSLMKSCTSLAQVVANSTALDEAVEIFVTYKFIMGGDEHQYSNLKGQIQEAEAVGKSIFPKTLQ